MLVQSDAHVLSSIRYILGNPARAGVGHRVGDWTWTSLAETRGTRSGQFVDSDAMLSYLGSTRAAALAVLTRLVEDDDGGSGLAHPLIDGDEPFVAEHLEHINPSPEHPRLLTMPGRPPLGALVADDDPIKIVQAHRDYGYSMRQIAEHLGVGVATISRRISAYEHEQRTWCDANGTWKT